MPITLKNNPLNQSHCDCINRVLESIPDTQELLDCMQRCGLNVTDLQEKVNLNRTRAESIKREFFPNAV
jgi:hypothetical protein